MTRVMIRTGAAALLAGFAATSGGAAPDLSTKETRAVTHGYARCVVDRQHARASQAILANADNAEILRRYPKLIIGECLTRQLRTGATMTFSGELYRYALADALVAEEFSEAPAPVLAVTPALAHNTPGTPPPPLPADAGKSARKKYDEAVADYTESVGYAFLSRYGECIVRTDTPGAKALLLTDPDSEDEGRSFVALQDAFANCLEEGQTLTFGKVALRGSIAINYYRLAHAAGQKAAG